MKNDPVPDKFQWKPAGHQNQLSDKYGNYQWKIWYYNPFIDNRLKQEWKNNLDKRPDHHAKNDLCN